MIARKCDRCGKLYEDYALRIEEKDRISTPYSINGFKTGSNGMGYYNGFIDLCPECMNELIEWYKAGKEQQKTEND